MSLRKAYHWRPLIAVLAMTMLVVALACGGEEAATPTTPPTATTRPTATVAVPTATTVAPTATSSVPTATLLPGEPTATATVAATSTPVPSATVRPDQAADWVGFLMSHPGYQAKWGTPQY
ncbi:MAG: hypothetical protein HY672_05070, partial [Chloroflexi bacterium]|nr:hypothetical protein [Chloroflexota bacterium]